MSDEPQHPPSAAASQASGETEVGGSGTRYGAAAATPLIPTDPGVARRRWWIILLLIAAVAVWHGAVPVGPAPMHAVHIVLRKVFLVPILFGAVWFGLRGAVVAAGLVSAVYLPYVFLAWSGKAAENLNQAGEVVTFWIVGLLAGWLIGRERRALRRVAEVSRDALNALVAALDAREHETEQHSLRVAGLAGRIGRRMGLGPRELGDLHEAAILHDVGKIGVPDRVLLKPGPLTEEERRIMQGHAQMGFDILNATTHLRGVAELVRSHHERFDGGGYPQGLGGPDIPLGARIFAVADVFDALTSDRPYRRAMTRQTARQTIVDGSGSHFDPAAVAAFCEVLAEADAVPPPADPRSP